MNENTQQKQSRASKLWDTAGLYFIILLGSSFIWIPLLFFIIDMFSGNIEPSNYCPTHAEDRGRC